MKRILKTLSLVFLSIFFTACGKPNLSDYYFPLKKMQEQPLVYEYALTSGQQSISLYWYYQTVVQKDSIYFVGTCYDSSFHQMLISTEERVKNGMKLKDLRYFGVNTEGLAIEFPATIEGGAVFPFEVKDDKSVFINVIKYRNPRDSAVQTTLTRNRRFIKTTTVEYQGKKYDAVEFEMKEEVAEKDPQKGGWAHVFTIQEVYAKDLGLVYSKRDLGNGAALESRLVNIFTMKELEQRFAQKMNQ